MGTPEFAVSSLAAIHNSKHKIVGVVTSVDKPAGRGRKINQSDVKKYALQEDLPIYQPSNLKSKAFINDLKFMNPDVIVVVAFRMLPKVVWSMPKFGTFNLHASLLPKYRGAAPIHWAVINGEAETGVTTFFIDEKIDTGEIILNKKETINPDENTGKIYSKLMNVGAQLVLETLSLIENKGTKIETKKQDLNTPTPSAPKLTKENTRINWNWKPKELYNFVRGLNPYPLAWCKLLENDKTTQVKIYEVEYEINNHNKAIGELLIEKKRLGVFVNGGILFIKVLKVQGKKKMNIADFLNGNKLELESKFL